MNNTENTENRSETSHFTLEAAHAVITTLNKIRELEAEKARDKANGLLNPISS